MKKTITDLQAELDQQRTDYETKLRFIKHQALSAVRWPFKRDGIEANQAVNLLVQELDYHRERCHMLQSRLDVLESITPLQSEEQTF